MPQLFMSFKHENASVPRETRGVVYTKPWVVELLLDLAGYTSDANLVDSLAIEPAAGEGAFLEPMIKRLLESCRSQGRPFSDCVNSLLAYEIDEQSSNLSRKLILSTLTRLGIDDRLANEYALKWIVNGDYLLDAPNLSRADFVIGNPPYIRLEDVPAEKMSLYRQTYPTMRSRADLYVAFFEAALRQLKSEGVCAFICADRWMLNQYGAELRQLVTSGYCVRVILEMHNAEAFDSDVSAYPAISVIQPGKQGRATVASIKAPLESTKAALLTSYLLTKRSTEAVNPLFPDLHATFLDRWFNGSDPWPCSKPKHLQILRHLEQTFPPLEDGKHTRVGIGVATGCDRVFITTNAQLVESDRLIPLAMAQDTLKGQLSWSGHYLVDPWDVDGLVKLPQFPRLREYFEANKAAIERRHTARKNPAGWYRTIDRITHSLTSKPKLLIPDIKNAFNPVLDQGKTYPHHNLYFICSDVWDLEVLGGILLSKVGLFFIEAYGVRMRGGYLRFQAQYLRRIRVPNPWEIQKNQAEKLIHAFRERDRELASEVAFEIYKIEPRTFDSVEKSHEAFDESQ